MQPINIERLRTFAYHLFYPAVLGSIIFDILDPLRTFPNLWSIAFFARIGQYLIAIAFIADFLHMTVDLEAEKKNKAKDYFLDTVIALLFCLTYFALAKVTTKGIDELLYYGFITSFGLSLGCLTITYFLIFYYEYNCEHTASWQNLSRLVPFLICSVGFDVVRFGFFDTAHVAFITITLSSFWYTFYVFLLAKLGISGGWSS